MPITLYRNGTYFLYSEKGKGRRSNPSDRTLPPGRYEQGDIFQANTENKGGKDRPFKLSSRQKATIISRHLTIGEYALHIPRTFILTYNSSRVVNTKSDLNTFLTRARRDFKFNSYIWCLELTDNKQFHYHFMADCPYIDIEKFNQAWCSTRGYFSKNAVRAIEQVKGARKVGDYGAKTYKTIGRYVSKKEKYKDEGIGQRLWGSSAKIKHLNISLTDCDPCCCACGYKCVLVYFLQLL